MLVAIIQKYAIMPELLEILRCFQDKTCDTEEAFGGAIWKRCKAESNGLHSRALRNDANGQQLTKAHRNGIRLEIPRE